MSYDPQPEASHYVNGAYLEDTDGPAIPVIYPATGAEIARLHSATDQVIETALAAAGRAQKDWAAMTGRERGRVLTDAARIMRERNRALSELETLDTGKPLQETLVADATSAADALEYFGGLAGSLASLLIGGAVWGLGHASGHSMGASRGKAFALGGMAGAILVGLAATIVNTLAGIA